MIIERLEARNFRKLNVELDIPRGVLLIMGPNEAGKSTILEAILFALYGRYLRGRKELAINHKSNTAMVKLQFKVGNRRFIVERKISRSMPSTAYLLEVLSDGRKIVKASTPKKVDETIKEIIGGISFKELLASNVVAQKELEKIVQMNRSERSAIINAFLNIESFTKSINELKERKKELEGTQKIKGILKQEREKLKALEETYKKYIDAKAELKALEESFDNLIIELNNKSSEYVECYAKYQKLQEYKSALAEKKGIEERILDLRKRIESLENEINELEKDTNRMPLLMKELEELEDVDEQLKAAERIEELLSNLNGINIQKRELKKKLSELNKVKEERMKYKDSAAKLEEIDEKIKQLSASMEKLYFKPRKAIPYIVAIAAGFALLLISVFLGLIISGIGFLSFIFTAYRDNRKIRILNEKIKEISREKEKYLLEAKLYSEMQKISEETSKIEKQILDLNEKISQINSELTSLANILGQNLSKSLDLDIVRKLKENLKRKSYRKRELTVQVNAIKEKISRLTAKRKEYNAAREALQNLVERLRSIKVPELPEGLKYSDEILNKLKDETNRLSQDIGRIVEKLRNNASTRSNLMAYIEENKDIEGKLEEQRRIVKKFEREHKIILRTIRALEVVSQNIRSSFIPSVENYMSRIISRITNGRYKAVKLDEDYNLKVFDSAAGKFIEKDIYSGGTVDQFLLAMRLAFVLSLIPHGKGVYPKFLFLDEPLSSSDNIRRENILELLSKDLREFFEQIIIITHLENIRRPEFNIIRLEEGRIVDKYYVSKT